MDPDLQLDIITELDLVNTTLGVTQVSGLHNASKAFLFQGKGAASLAPGTAWGRGQPGGVLTWRVFVGRSSLLCLLCYCHKECSEMLRVFRYPGGVLTV